VIAPGTPVRLVKVTGVAPGELRRRRLGDIGVVVEVRDAAVAPLLVEFTGGERFWLKTSEIEVIVEGSGA
jgi:hypothetical protein